MPGGLDNPEVEVEHLGSPYNKKELVFVLLQSKPKQYCAQQIRHHHHSETNDAWPFHHVLPPEGLHKICKHSDQKNVCAGHHCLGYGYKYWHNKCSNRE